MVCFGITGFFALATDHARELWQRAEVKTMDWRPGSDTVTIQFYGPEVHKAKSAKLTYQVLKGCTAFLFLTSICLNIVALALSDRAHVQAEPPVVNPVKRTSRKALIGDKDATSYLAQLDVRNADGDANHA